MYRELGKKICINEIVEVCFSEERLGMLVWESGNIYEQRKFWK